MRPQIKTITQAVTPNEYDAAVARDPLCSILTATGDRRPGRLLLADSGADRFRSIAAMAATPAGRADLDCLAAATEAFASALDADGEGS